MTFLKKRHSEYKGGFTLIEVTVVIVIFSILSAISIVNYRGFDNSVKLKNQAMNVALAIKLAQTKAFSSRETAGGVPYGVYLDTIDASYMNKSNSFIDMDKDRIFDAGDTILTNDQIVLESGYTISKICADNGSGCMNPLNETKLFISYLRPNVDAKICLGIGDCTLTNYSQAQITIASPKNATTTVFVTNMGQIYVQ
jgi:prepilin-type N-terminal cleavage/methylation domain-containing protein